MGSGLEGARGSFVAEVSGRLLLRRRGIDDERACRRLQCGHSFHGDCVFDWWRVKAHGQGQLDCPVCRRVQDQEVSTTSVEIVVQV